MSEELRSVLEKSEVPTPEVAAQNINRSRAVEISPDEYSDLKFELDPKVMARERIPSNVGDVTKEFLTENKQRLGLAQDDVHKMSDTEKRLKNFANKAWNLPTRTRERNELAREKFFSKDGTLSPEKEENLQDLNRSVMEMSNEDYDLDSSDTERLFTDAAAGMVDMVRPFIENKELVIGSGLTTGLLGAAGGFIGTGGNPIGAVAGFKMGAGPGLASAMVTVPFLDAYVQTRDSIYNDLSYETQTAIPLRVRGTSGVDIQNASFESSNVSHERKQNISRGVALISGVAAGTVGKVLTSNNPFLRKFLNPGSASKYVLKNPALMAKLDLVGGILAGGGAEGVEEGVQQLAETIALRLGKVDGSEESFMNALDGIWKDRKEITKDVVYAASVGSLAGSGFSSVTNVPQYKSVKKEYEKVQEIGRQKQEVLETQNMMLEANAIMSNTKVQKLAPEEAKTFKTS